jgi:hypothetical protein
MTYSSFIESTNRLLQDIQSKDIEIYNNPPQMEKLNEEEINECIQFAEKYDKVKLPSYFKEIVFTDTFQLYWKYTRDNNVTTGGEFIYKTPMEVFIDKSRKGLAHQLTSYGTTLYKEGYRFFDGHPHAGDGIEFAIKIENGTIADTVWYVHIIHEEIYPMQLNYAEYIEHSLYLKGMYDWQKLFIDEPLNAWGVDLSLLKKRLEDYPKLFSGYDMSSYLKLYKEKGGK